jgi:hypothetical protein
VAEVQIRPGGIETLLDLQGFSTGELVLQLGLDQELVGPRRKTASWWVMSIAIAVCKPFVTFAKIGVCTCH